MKLLPIPLALLVAALAGPQSPQKTIWSGVYTATQAERGRNVYETHCMECHHGDLESSNTAARLLGDRFLDRWREDNLGYLFHFVSTSMPRRAPASLTKKAYVDVIAFLLDRNKLPAGSVELSEDLLNGIQVQHKDGPRPLPNGALGQLAGCLSVDPDDTWTLTRAPEPARARTPLDLTASEIETARTARLGSGTFRLENFEYVRTFRPLDHIGHKVFVKGTIIRQTNRERIRLTSIQLLDTTCDP